MIGNIIAAIPSVSAVPALFDVLVIAGGGGGLGRIHKAMSIKKLRMF